MDGVWQEQMRQALIALDTAVREYRRVNNEGLQDDEQASRLREAFAGVAALDGRFSNGTGENVDG